jgi:hypothetical protein
MYETLGMPAASRHDPTGRCHLGHLRPTRGCLFCPHEPRPGPGPDKRCMHAWDKLTMIDPQSSGFTSVRGKIAVMTHE